MDASDASHHASGSCSAHPGRGVVSERGVVGLAEPNPQAYREHGRFQLQTGNGPTWSHPVVANGKLFLRDQDTIYAYLIR